MREARRIAGVHSQRSPSAVPANGGLPRAKGRKFWGQARLSRATRFCAACAIAALTPTWSWRPAPRRADIGWIPRWAWTRATTARSAGKKADYSLLFDVRQRRASSRCTRAPGSGRMISARACCLGRYKVRAGDAVSRSDRLSRSGTTRSSSRGRPTTSCSRRCTPTGPSSASSHRASRDFPASPRRPYSAIWTDIDRMRDDRPYGAGQIPRPHPQGAAALADQVVKAADRRGARKAADANDVYKDGAAAISRCSTSFGPLSVDADPRSGGDFRTTQPSLVGWNHPQVGVCWKPGTSCASSGGQPTCRVSKKWAVHQARTPAETLAGWRTDWGWISYTGGPPAASFVTQRSAASWPWRALGRRRRNAPAVLAGADDQGAGAAHYGHRRTEYRSRNHLASLPVALAPVARPSGALLLSTQPAVRLRPRSSTRKERPQQSFQHAPTSRTRAGLLLSRRPDPLRVGLVSFLFWDGRRWARDRTFRSRPAGPAHVVRQLYEGAPGRREVGAQVEIRRAKLAAMVNLVRKRPGIPILPQWLDSDVPAPASETGRSTCTGSFWPAARRTSSPSSRTSQPDPDAKCPVWEKFFAQDLRWKAGPHRLRAAVRRLLAHRHGRRSTCCFLLYGTGQETETRSAHAAGADG